MNTVAANLGEIKRRISLAAERAGRNPKSIELAGVSKFHQVDRIREAAAAGVRVFAESRQQEAQTKLPLLKGLGEWHFIGPLQSNKARSVAGLFDVVQSVDSVRLAEKLSQAALALGKTLRIYAQVNISRETQKQGFAPEDDDAIAGLASLPGLALEGLMGMAAATDNPEGARPAFKELAALRKRLKARGLELRLSMGMSHDFEIAIEEGADLLRIGTALFQ